MGNRHYNCRGDKNAFCAISFNSTILSELLSMPIGIIAPFICVSQNETDNATLFDADRYPDSGVYKVTSFFELENVLNECSKTNPKKYSSNIREELCNRYLSWNSKTISSKRVENAILEQILERA